MAEDLRLELPELGAGLDPELLDEARAGVLVRLESLCLASRALEREHQLAPERLAQRMLADERLELADDVAVPSQLEIRVDPLADGDEPQLVEATDLRLREVLEGELGQSRPAPEGERAGESLAALLGRQPPRVGERALEAVRVDLFRVHPQHVPGRLRDKNVRADLLAQLRDEVVERRRCGPRGLRAPEVVNELVGGHDLPYLEQERGEDGPLVLPAQGERPTVGEYLRRSEDPELDPHESLLAPSATSVVRAFA